MVNQVNPLQTMQWLHGCNFVPAGKASHSSESHQQHLGLKISGSFQAANPWISSASEQIFVIRWIFSGAEKCRGSMDFIRETFIFDEVTTKLQITHWYYKMVARSIILVTFYHFWWWHIMKYLQMTHWSLRIFHHWSITFDDITHWSITEDIPWYSTILRIFNWVSPLPWRRFQVWTATHRCSLKAATVRTSLKRRRIRRSSLTFRAKPCWLMNG